MTAEREEHPEAGNEAALIERAKERSPSAWAEIYDRHYSQLFRYCHARTGDTATAADLASRVYLEALEGIDRFVYRGRPILAWLYRIARNVVSDHLRAQGREREAIERAGAALEPHSPNPASVAGDRHDLAQAVERLTQEQRQVVLLRFFAGFTTREIAQAMDRSEAAVYSLEVRALAALRRLLEGPSKEKRHVA
jgi:RNA polymerase sigma-70 factor (ECF subfamily)